MAISVKHAFTSPKSDGADTTLVQPSNWNAEHTITAAAGKVLGRDTSGAGAIQELPIAVDVSGNVALGGALSVDGNTTLGNASNDSVTVNAGTVSIPNNVNFSGGNVGIGASSLASNVTLHVADRNNSTVGLLLGREGTNTEKFGRLGFTHYAGDNTLSVIALNAFSGSTSNLVVVGGGTSVGYAATELRFFTAGNNTTTYGTERMRITADGTVTLASTSGLSIGRTAVTAPAATDGNVFSGTYTPTLTNATNVASSTAFSCQYMRVGNVVTVSGNASVTATATGSVAVGISIPVPSNFASANQLAGTAVGNSAAARDPGIVNADEVDDVAKLLFTASTTTAVTRYFTFTYRVI